MLAGFARQLDQKTRHGGGAALPIWCYRSFQMQKLYNTQYNDNVTKNQSINKVLNDFGPCLAC